MHSFPHRWIWAMLLSLCCAFGARPARASTIIVDADCTLTDAILSANSDSEISDSNCEVGNGNDLLILEGGATYSFNEAYVMRGYGDISALPEITSTITISGNGATVQRTPELNTCEILELFEDNPEQFRLFEVGTEGNLTLHHVIVENGCAVNGGGIANRGTLTVIDSYIRANTGMSYEESVGGGGGIYNNGGTVTLINSHLVSNTVLGGEIIYYFSGGGGVCNFDGTLNIINSSIVANHVEQANAGGGICNLSGSVFITGSHILSNTTGIYASGGGIYSGDDLVPGLSGKSALHISDSYILSNTTTGSGGGIDSVGTSLTIKRSQLAGNRAENHGGALSISYSSTVKLDGTQIVANNAGERGGGIFSRESTVTITRVGLIRNTAGNTGGALYQALPREDDEYDIYPDGSIRMSQSRILSNSSVAVYSEGETVDGVDNWWGHPDGPSGEGDGDGDSISNHVLFEPYKTEDFPIDAPADFRHLFPYLLKE
jgi:hypothetical protein